MQGELGKGRAHLKAPPQKNQLETEEEDKCCVYISNNSTKTKLTISPNMSPLQLVSSGLMPASDLSDGVGDTGGLELVLPKRITLSGITGASEEKLNLNVLSPDRGSDVAVVGGDVMVPAVELVLCCKVPFFKSAALPQFCSW